MSNTIKIKRGTNLSNAGTPAAGELIYKSDTNQLFVGDGSTAATGLSPIGGSASGDIEGVTAGVGLSGGGGTGTVTLTVDLSELTDMTQAVNSSQDELIILDNGADRRKLISEIPLSAFNNDSGFITTDTTLSTEAVQDIVGAMFSSNTETRVAATYDDTNGKINVVVDDMTADNNTVTTNIAGTGIDVSSGTGNSTISVDVSDFMTNGVNNRVLTATGTDGINAESSLTFSGTQLTNTGDIKITSGSLGVNTNAASGDGRIRATSYITAGYGTGGVALTHNDGYGNANVTFNHEAGVPEQNGQSARIEVNTDATSTEGLMYFEVSSSDVTSGSAVSLTNALTLAHDYIEVPSRIRHMGDTNTYIQYDSDRIYLVAGGTTKYDSNNGNVIATGDILDQDNMSSNSATAVASQQSIKAYVDAEVAGVVNSAPAALNTLDELAAALGDDANFATTTSTSLGNRLRVDTASQGLTGTQQANAITNLGITATKAELNYVDGVTSNIQTQLNGKLSTSGTAANSTLLNNLGAGSFLRSDAADSFTGSTLAITGDLNVDSNTLYVDSADSRVGIATTSPDELLHIFGAAPFIKIENSTETSGGILFVDQQDEGQNASVRFDASARSLDFLVDSGEAMTILGTGSSRRVGIGSTTPYERLYVQCEDATSPGIVSNPGATNGAIAYAIGYGDANRDYINTWGMGYSSGANVFGYAVKPSTTADEAFINSADNSNFTRGALYFDNELKFFNAGATTGTIDTAITMTERFKIDSSGNLTLSGTVDGRDVASDGSKLDGIESGATADQTAAQILTAIKTVDGAGSGLDADTLDGLQASSFTRKGSTSENTPSSRTTFNSYNDIESANGHQSSLEVFNDTAGNDAFMQFHVSSDYALYFGLDGSTNDLAVGGWSKGANKYKIWHAGNDGSGSTLDADLLDGYHLSTTRNSANTVPVRNGSGYLDLGWINTTSGNTTTASSDYYVNTNDGYIRKKTLALVRTEIMGVSAGTSFLRSDADDSVTGIITFEEAVNMNATDTGERLFFKNNGTTVGDIGTNDTTWLRINQSTAKNIYTPRYIRADNGFFVDGATQGITGGALFRAASGSAAAPALSFASSTALGFYKNGTSSIRFSANNAIRGTWDGDGLDLDAGSLGVNTSANGTNGMIHATNDIIAFSSDKRLKENIRPIENALDKVSKLSGFVYNWNELANEKAEYDMDKDYVGVYAQDVEEVQPEAVDLAPFDNDGKDNSISGEKYLTVKYDKLVPLLIESIKELKAEIEELKK